MKIFFSSLSRAGSVIDISTIGKIHQFLAVTPVLYSEEIDFCMVKIQSTITLEGLQFVRFFF